MSKFFYLRDAKNSAELSKLFGGVYEPSLRRWRFPIETKDDVLEYQLSDTSSEDDDDDDDDNDSPNDEGGKNHRSSGESDDDDDEGSIEIAMPVDKQPSSLTSTVEGPRLRKRTHRAKSFDETRSDDDED